MASSFNCCFAGCGDADLIGVGQISSECGWCALSPFDPSEGFGLKYEKELETFDGPCADQPLVGSNRFVKLCELTRATVTVFEDCPGEFAQGSVV